MFLVGCTSEFEVLATAAGQQAFPQIPVVSQAHIPAGGSNKTALTPGALLVLCAPDAATVERVIAFSDTTRLPEHAVVVVGSELPPSNDDPFEVIPLGLGSAEGLAHVFRSAWQRFRLRRENARLRGDLMAFGTRIAHDLRTPLGGVLTTTEMLQEILAEDAPTTVPLMQPILDSTYGLVTLIERTSFFARAIATSEPATQVDMGTPFWNAFQQLESQILKAGAAFTHPADWPTVIAHEAWLEKIWRILFTNALQHGTPGTKVEAGWRKGPDGFRFWVRNQGTVTPEKRATLFFPFQRLHEAGAPRGLSLSILQRLVELDGGFCGFDAPAAGTVEFSFVLPATPDA